MASSGPDAPRQGPVAGLATRANLPDEVGSIDFHALVSGPLVALIDAQIASAIATTDFVVNVCFKTDHAKDEEGNKRKNVTIGDTIGEPVMVNFSYPVATEFGLSRKQTLEVPLLTMVPIPMLRIENATLSFQAKITDTYTQTRDSKVTYQKASTTMGVGTNPDKEENASKVTDGSSGENSVSSDSVQDKFQNTVMMSAVVANTRSTSKGFDVTREYTMKVTIKAAQDDLPAGLSRLIGILEQQMQTQPELSGLQNASLANLGNIGKAGGGAAPSAAPAV
mmetsp:Transcript_30586/g.76742  ORF Transcript_30586/g.76742 Transcript_30586/m.76742 type:complete len:280 (+) Transcript_30586:149-988(+)|eukprot:CAMPEP_0177657234 /NCGR_PEP_ID=MMETSP0447-20121125/16067_1 /TAXON_ID=0 /ORGANISM="Stygamoeba regulata, Strain BSH-02190019" /LENGTH=279 /DNA_ID=CAMNT_0019161557 /DNA_START=156 /DNA_END=995 /DNA_ORIENTATION=+